MTILNTEPATFTPTLEDISAILEDAVDQGASDIILKHLAPPIMKLNGEWHPVPDLPEITISDLEELLKTMLGSEKFAVFAQEKEADFRLSTDRHSFRVNASYQRGGPKLTFRPVPKAPPTLEDLQLLEAERIIPAMKRLIEQPRGLVLITGGTGSGKSTTLAAMIHHVNQHYRRNIVTIEDPIEFVHEDHKAIIAQREIGQDTHGFAQALRGVLRQTPDIILVGEMRDPETIEAAITAAETGHLVISTVHTNNAPSSITRIVDAMPEGRIHQIRTQLAATLKGVITQQLVPRADGQGRQVVLEVMLVNPQIQQLIGDGETALNKYYDDMAAREADGSTLMDRQLAVGVQQNILAASSAESRVMQRERYARYLQSLPASTSRPADVRNAWTR
ncbi:type IV pilus twitching motility protein PilT [Deinococcus sp. YIM 77859]|uniref:type IV pilus twitching motility protein PilT n=1 Tax=Deinococcus sp. YIM 77859 TaxID=1540221 RepID=UPI00068AEE92|nr:PilT/PilU family type 4a pilus ATPase [Deinococcus sp. YIM 77859]